jgi:hypothetical protein
LEATGTAFLEATGRLSQKVGSHSRDIANQECSSARVSAIQVLSHTTTFFCNSMIKPTKKKLN